MNPDGHHVGFIGRREALARNRGSDNCGYISMLYAFCLSLIVLLFAANRDVFANDSLVSGMVSVSFPKGFGIGLALNPVKPLLIEVGAGTWLPPFPILSVSATIDLAVFRMFGVGVSFVKTRLVGEDLRFGTNPLSAFLTYPSHDQGKSYFFRLGTSHTVPSQQGTSIDPGIYAEAGFRFWLW